MPLPRLLLFRRDRLQVLGDLLLQVEVALHHQVLELEEVVDSQERVQDRLVQRLLLLLQHLREVLRSRHARYAGQPARRRCRQRTCASGVPHLRGHSQVLQESRDQRLDHLLELLVHLRGEVRRARGNQAVRMSTVGVDAFLGAATGIPLRLPHLIVLERILVVDAEDDALFVHERH